MKMKHAEEWQISKHGTPDHSPQYGIHNGGNDFCIVKGDDAKAKAQLLSAAPDLLEALRAVVDCKTPPATWETQNVVKIARAAIARATGGKP